MELNVETIVLVIIGLSGLFLVGFVLKKHLGRLQRRRELQKKLNEITGVTHLQASKKEFFSDKLLVLDKANKKLVFLDYFNVKNNAIIDLQDLKECKLHVRNLVVQLELKFDNPYRDSCFIVFYQRFIAPEYERYRLTIKARRWNDMLTQAIASTREFEYGITG